MYFKEGATTSRIQKKLLPCYFSRLGVAKTAADCFLLHIICWLQRRNYHSLIQQHTVRPGQYFSTPLPMPVRNWICFLRHIYGWKGEGGCCGGRRGNQVARSLVW